MLKGQFLNFNPYLTRIIKLLLQVAGTWAGYCAGLQSSYKTGCMALFATTSTLSNL